MGGIFVAKVCNCCNLSWHHLPILVSREKKSTAARFKNKVCKWIASKIFNWFMGTFIWWIWFLHDCFSFFFQNNVSDSCKKHPFMWCNLREECLNWIPVRKKFLCCVWMPWEIHVSICAQVHLISFIMNPSVSLFALLIFPSFCAEFWKFLEDKIFWCCIFANHKLELANPEKLTYNWWFFSGW